MVEISTILRAVLVNVSFHHNFCMCLESWTSAQMWMRVIFFLLFSSFTVRKATQNVNTKLHRRRRHRRAIHLKYNGDDFRIWDKRETWFLTRPPTRRHHRHVIMLASHRIHKKDILDTAGDKGRRVTSFPPIYMDSLNSHRRVRENVMLMKSNLRISSFRFCYKQRKKTKSESINKTEMLAGIR